jgi:hypothetical protein
MCSLYGQNGSIDYGLVALLVEAETGDLRKQIVQVRPGTRMLVCADDSNVLLSIRAEAGP